MFANWGLNNSYPGIIIPGLVSAFGVFMMTQFFKSLPAEMREAAIVDGASELRIFCQIYLPLARPGVATLALFTFLQSWDALLWPMIMAPKPDMRTLQVGLAFINQTALTWNNTMAAVVLSVIPVVMAFLFAQGQFIAGISAGARSRSRPARALVPARAALVRPEPRRPAAVRESAAPAALSGAARR